MAIAFAVDAPRPFEANPGLISFQAQQPVEKVEVKVNGRRYAIVDLERPSRRATVGPIGLPPRDITVTVVGWADGRAVGSQTAENVLGLPKASMTIRPIRTTPRRAQLRMRQLRHPSTAAASWAVNLASGKGASYNAGARFTAASTAKLPVMIALLMKLRTDVTATSAWGPLQSMIRSSSNDAANQVLTILGGSTAGGGARATAVARALGATRTDTAAGYLPGQDRRLRAAAPPVQVVDQPDVPCCKVTTAHDLGVMMQSIVEAAAGRGKARRMGLTGRDARVALWLLAHTSYPGLFRPWTPFVTAHKIGDVDRAWHDVAAVFTPRGPLITVAMTDNPAGASESAAAQYGRAVLRIALTGLRPDPPPKRPDPPALPDLPDAFS